MVRLNMFTFISEEKSDEEQLRIQMIVQVFK